MRREGEPRSRSSVRLFLIAGFLVGLGLAIFVSPLASGSPDGLEKVAHREGFEKSAKEHHLAGGPLADYGISGVDNTAVGTALSGLIGTSVTMGVGVGLFGVVSLVRGRRRARDATPD